MGAGVGRLLQDLGVYSLAVVGLSVTVFDLWTMQEHLKSTVGPRSNSIIQALRPPPQTRAPTPPSHHHHSTPITYPFRFSLGGGGLRDAPLNAKAPTRDLFGVDTR